MKTRALILALPIAGALALSSTAWAAEAAAPGDTATALQQAQELIESGKYKEAAALCEHASKLASGPCPECLLGVARAYTGAGQLTAAVQVTRMAIPLLSSSPEDQAKAYVQLGALLVRNGAPAAESDQAFRHAVALDSRMEGEVRTQLAESLLVRARQEAAKKQPAATEVPVVVANRSGRSR
ncbi:MAG TPA: tetratricopeptide repeat protein [Thermoanaerobaculia bacterium]|jgi:thioredoxin-like negative regulator of GroEL|nr:tetratricopeptide repeat protein [Thermoanaerobaculia bacterium]